MSSISHLVCDICGFKHQYGERFEGPTSVGFAQINHTRGISLDICSTNCLIQFAEKRRGTLVGDQISVDKRKARVSTE